MGVQSSGVIKHSPHLGVKYSPYLGVAGSEGCEGEGVPCSDGVPTADAYLMRIRLGSNFEYLYQVLYSNLQSSSSQSC